MLASTLTRSVADVSENLSALPVTIANLTT
jgi:hypothetical protein